MVFDRYPNELVIIVPCNNAVVTFKLFETLGNALTYLLDHNH